MTTSPIYVLDANTLIEAKRRYYAFDLCPGFWNALLWLEDSKQVCSIDKVRDDLEKGNDDLWDWAKNTCPTSMFHPSTASEVGAAYRLAQSWVQSHSLFFPSAKAEFATVSDSWLIAYTMARGGVLVTQEVLSVEARNRVPIPNVCQALGVQYQDTFAFLRQHGTRFGWAGPP